MTRVLVTGATGFVGTALVQHLAGRGMTVRSAVRVPCRVSVGEAVAVGDVGPETDWTEALAGVDAVAHLAARVHQVSDTAADPLAAFRRVNVEGTRRLAEAAAVAGVRRFVLLSSVKALADRSGDTPLTDETPPFPATAYGLSKLKAERAVAQACAGKAMEWTALRPPLVYGPGVGANFRRLLSLCRQGLPLPLAAVRNRRSLIARANLVDAIERCIVHPAAARRVFLVQDGPTPSTADLVRTLSEHLGRPARLFAVPPRLLETAFRLAGRSGAFDRLAGSLHVDDTPFRHACGWHPPVPQADALRETAVWFADEMRRRTSD